MTRHIPVLTFTNNAAGGSVAGVNIDSSIDQNWIIDLSGTDGAGNFVGPSHVLIDNTGINSTIYINDGQFRTSISPYTRKTFPLTRGQSYLQLTVSQGTVPVFIFNYDPGIPDEVNEVASGIAAVGGGSSSGFTTWNNADRSANIVLTGSQLVVGNSAAGGIGLYDSVRSIASKTAGKFYYEHTISALYEAVGVANSVASLATYAGIDNNSIAFYWTGGIKIGNVDVVTIAGGYNNGDTIAIAFDVTAQLFWAKKLGGLWNGSGSADPSTGAGGISIAALGGTLFAIATAAQNTPSGTSNFGASPFLGSVPTGFAGITP